MIDINEEQIRVDEENDTPTISEISDVPKYYRTHVIPDYYKTRATPRGPPHDEPILLSEHFNELFVRALLAVTTGLIISTLTSVSLEIAIIPLTTVQIYLFMKPGLYRIERVGAMFGVIGGFAVYAGMLRWEAVPGIVGALLLLGGATFKYPLTFIWYAITLTFISLIYVIYSTLLKAIPIRLSEEYSFESSLVVNSLSDIEFKADRFINIIQGVITLLTMIITAVQVITMFS